jgi:hypothetical protein
VATDDLSLELSVHSRELGLEEGRERDERRRVGCHG